MNKQLRGRKMPHTEAFIHAHIQAGGAGDVAFAIGDREGEAYRFFASSRGDVQNGQTQYDMMSVSKIMTVAPLFQIAMEEGKVSPEDPLGKYFPEAPADKRDIPLWMLLSHCSGMGRYVFPEYFGPDRRAEAIEFQIRHPLLFTPGTDYFYSCSAFILLGFLLERLYNAPFDRLFDDRIARPLGLRSTSFRCREDANIVRCTRKAYEGDNKCSDDNNRRLYGVSGNAGIFSCLDDMTVFGHSLLNRHDKLMRKESFLAGAKDLTPTLSIGRALGYVYADKRYKQGGALLSAGSLGHTGFSGTAVFADYEKDLYVVSLTNTALYAFNRGLNCSVECANFREGLHNAVAADLGIANG